MKKIIKAIRNKIDWILIILGSFMMTYGFFGFSIMGGRPLRFLGHSKTIVNAYAYYYTPRTQMTIAIGVVLLVLGLLIRKDRKE